MFPFAYLISIIMEMRVWQVIVLSILSIRYCIQKEEKQRIYGWPVGRYPLHRSSRLREVGSEFNYLKSNFSASRKWPTTLKYENRVAEKSTIDSESEEKSHETIRRLLLDPKFTTPLIAILRDMIKSGEDRSEVRPRIEADDEKQQNIPPALRYHKDYNEIIEKRFMSVRNNFPEFGERVDDDLASKGSPKERAVLNVERGNHDEGRFRNYEFQNNEWKPFSDKSEKEQENFDNQPQNVRPSGPKVIEEFNLPKEPLFNFNNWKPMDHSKNVDHSREEKTSSQKQHKSYEPSSKKFNDFENDKEEALIPQFLTSYGEVFREPSSEFDGGKRSSREKGVKESSIYEPKSEGDVFLSRNQNANEFESFKPYPKGEDVLRPTYEPKSEDNDSQNRFTKSNSNQNGKSFRGDGAKVRSRFKSTSEGVGFENFKQYILNDEDDVHPTYEPKFEDNKDQNRFMKSNSNQNGRGFRGNGAEVRSRFESFKPYPNGEDALNPKVEVNKDQNRFTKSNSNQNGRSFRGDSAEVRSRFESTSGVEEPLNRNKNTKEFESFKQYPSGEDNPTYEPKSEEKRFQNHFTKSNSKYQHQQQIPSTEEIESPNEFIKSNDNRNGFGAEVRSRFEPTSGDNEFQNQFTKSNDNKKEHAPDGINFGGGDATTESEESLNRNQNVNGFENFKLYPLNGINRENVHPLYEPASEDDKDQNLFTKSNSNQNRYAPSFKRNGADSGEKYLNRNQNTNRFEKFKPYPNKEDDVRPTYNPASEDEASNSFVKSNHNQNRYAEVRSRFEPTTEGNGSPFSKIHSIQKPTSKNSQNLLKKSNRNLNGYAQNGRNFRGDSTEVRSSFESEETDSTNSFTKSNSDKLDSLSGRHFRDGADLESNYKSISESNESVIKSKKNRQEAIKYKNAKRKLIAPGNFSPREEINSVKNSKLIEIKNILEVLKSNGKLKQVEGDDESLLSQLGFLYPPEMHQIVSDIKYGKIGVPKNKDKNTGFKNSLKMKNFPSYKRLRSSEVSKEYKEIESENGTDANEMKNQTVNDLPNEIPLGVKKEDAVDVEQPKKRYSKFLSSPELRTDEMIAAYKAQVESGKISLSSKILPKVFLAKDDSIEITVSDKVPSPEKESNEESGKGPMPDAKTEKMISVEEEENFSKPEVEKGMNKSRSSSELKVTINKDKRVTEDSHENRTISKENGVKDDVAEVIKKIRNAKAPKDDGMRPKIQSVSWKSLTNETYNFGFDAKEDDFRQFRKEERLSNGTIKGVYGYKEPSGIYRVVEFLAGKNGYYADEKLYKKLPKDLE